MFSSTWGCFEDYDTSIAAVPLTELVPVSIVYGLTLILGAHRLRSDPDTRSSRQRASHDVLSLSSPAERHQRILSQPRYGQPIPSVIIIIMICQSQAVLQAKPVQLAIRSTII